MSTAIPGTAATATQQGHAAPAAQPPRRLSLAPAVTATAELMIVPDLTIVTAALPPIQNSARLLRTEPAVGGQRLTRR